MMHATRLHSRATRICVLLARLIAAALFSSLVMGASATAFQYIRVVPLILDAEAFEVDEQLNPNATVEPDEWAPTDGSERFAFTLLSNFVISLGFSLLVLGLSVADHEHVSARSGLQRGVAGWVIFMGLPCAGLSPELPGMAAAELTDRQWWWLYAVALGAAAFGIATTAMRMPPPKPASAASGAAANKLTFDALRHHALQTVTLAVAVVTAAIPHLTGAPHPHLATGLDGQEIETSTTCGAAHDDCERAGPPAEMAATYAVWCLATAFAYWVCLGVVCARAYNLAMGFEAPLPGEVSPTIEFADGSATTTEAI